MKSIIQFKNEYEFLSNFYPSPFDWDGLNWLTVEHAYQAAKCIYPDQRNMINAAEYPGVAKKLGRKVQLIPNWEQVKVSIMTELVWLKFKQNHKLQDRLLNTGSAELVEGNYWHDNFWGDCFCKKCSNQKGKNMLGFILMEVREMIRKELN